MKSTVDAQVLKRYEIMDELGRGGFGVVYKAKCRETNKVVALKQCKGVFSAKHMAHYAYMEVMILRALRESEGFVEIVEVVPTESLTDLYIAMECMDSDLSHVIRNTDDMSEHQMKYIIYHILKGVNELHARGLVHRDLKPQNILVDRCNEPYISDFGLATPVHHREDEGIPIGERVGTPGYMAPELFVSHSSLTYSKPVDIWAVGCIFADLLGGTVNSPLFYSKSSYQLVNNILDVVGFPSEGDVRQMGCDLDRGDTPEDSSSTANTIEGLRWRFPDASDDALDFLRLCLQFNPAKRPAAGELMNHKFFADFHFAEPEEAKGLIDIPCMRCPVYLSTEQYRRKILNAFNVPLPEALTIPVSMKELETSILSDIEVPADIYSTGLADNVREYQCGKSSCCDSLREFFPSASAQGLDFLRLCLKFNLPGGSTAEDLLRHPFLTLKDAPCDNKVVNAANDAVDAGNKPDLWTLPGDDSTKEEEISAEYLEDAIIKLIDADDESQGVAESPKLEDPAVVVPRRGSQAANFCAIRRRPGFGGGTKDSTGRASGELTARRRSSRMLQL